MKLLKLHSERDKQSYQFTCLETVEDVDKYRAVNEQVKSRQAVGFWFGFKSQTFRKEPLNYAVHEENTNTIGLVLATKMNFSESPISIIDFCTMSDDIINGMHESMYRLVNQGNMIRINKRGGYCPIDSFDEYQEVLPMNEQEMYNFLICGEVNMDFFINSNTIVIENDNYLPERLINSFHKLTNIPKDNMQIITSFKMKTILFKDEDFIKFFNDGIQNHNLKNIVFETTAQDSRQVDGIKKVFEYLMLKYPNKTLNIYVKTYESQKELFQTKLKNINIIFLHTNL